MTAFGEEIKFLPSIAHGLTDQFLAPVITFGRINNVQPGIKRTVQQLRDLFLRHIVIADLRSAKSEHANVHVGLAEASFFHGLLDNGEAECCEQLKNYYRGLPAFATAT